MDMTPLEIEINKLRPKLNALFVVMWAENGELQIAGSSQVKAESVFRMMALEIAEGSKMRLVIQGAPNRLITEISAPAIYIGVDEPFEHYVVATNIVATDVRQFIRSLSEVRNTPDMISLLVSTYDRQAKN